MDEAEFDRFADEFQAMQAASIAVSGESPDFLTAIAVCHTREDLAP
jgi:hypothetical protein